MKRVVLILSFLSIYNIGFSQSKYHTDVQTVDAIMSAIYDVISGDENDARDWERFHYLFAEDAKLIPTKKQENGEVNYRYWTPRQYEEMFTANRSAFFERELSRVTEAYGNIVHVFSTYETKIEKDGSVTNRGINSFQLLKDKDRYYIMNIFWSAESDGFPLPDKYLK